MAVDFVGVGRGAPRVLRTQRRGGTERRRIARRKLRAQDCAKLRGGAPASASSAASGTRAERQHAEREPGARKFGCAPQARAAPTSSVASAPPAASESAAAAAAGARGRTRRRGSRPRTVSANDAASRPIARLSVRKPSVYARDPRHLDERAGRQRPQPARRGGEAAWNAAAAVNCIVSEKPQLRGLRSVRPALTPAVLTLQRNQPATMARTRPAAGRAGTLEELAGEQTKLSFRQVQRREGVKRNARGGARRAGASAATTRSSAACTPHLPTARSRLHARR